MKKQTLLFTLVAGMCYLGLSSNTSNPSIGSAGNRTGVNGSTTNCGGIGCHGGNSSSVVAIITVNNTAGLVTSYVAGNTYTVTGASSMTHYGFEFAAVSGTSPSQVNAGTFSAFPSQVAMHTSGGINIVEHTSTISGSSFSKSFLWTAPTGAVGNVTMYATVNAVNGDGNQDASDLSGNKSIVLTRNTTGVASVANNIGVTAYPNPVMNSLNMNLDNAGEYTISVYEMSGKLMTSQNVTSNGAGQVSSIDCRNWAPGMYQLIAEKDGNRQTISVVKQ